MKTVRNPVTTYTYHVKVPAQDIHTVHEKTDEALDAAADHLKLGQHVVLTQEAKEVETYDLIGLSREEVILLLAVFGNTGEQDMPTKEFRDAHTELFRRFWRPLDDLWAGDVGTHYLCNHLTNVSRNNND